MAEWLNSNTPELAQTFMQRVMHPA
jgi:hypothetical protein